MNNKLSKILLLTAIATAFMNSSYGYANVFNSNCHMRSDTVIVTRTNKTHLTKSDIKAGKKYIYDVFVKRINDSMFVRIEYRYEIDIAGVDTSKQNYYDFEIIGISIADADRKDELIKDILKLFGQPEEFMGRESFEMYKDLYGEEWYPPETVDLRVLRTEGVLQIGSVKFDWDLLDSGFRRRLLDYAGSNKYRIR